MPNKDSAGAQAAREQLAQAMSELAKQAEDMGASLPGLEEAIKALQADQTDLLLRDLQAATHDLEKLKEMAKAMENLQQQMAKLGKDLAEQLKNGQAQAAQSTLKKMMDQLKESNPSKDQLQKIMDEISKAIDPAQQYGKAGDYLKDAKDEMKDGKNGEAGQSLAKAAQELDRMMQQMADAQALRDALDALQRAQMAIAMNKNWSECKMGSPCSACNGQGCAKCKGRGWGHGGHGPGGVGTWADETGWTYFPEHQEAVDNSGITRPDMEGRGLTDRGDGDHNPNLMPTKVHGQISPGGSMPSITLKGVSIPGQSSIQFEEAAKAAQSDAQSALNQDQVPRAYRGAVRDYFDDLKK
jgi:chemotaxis protein histidine kinase CheA